MTILIVDHSLTGRRSLNTEFSRAGHHVRLADSPTEARDAVRSILPALIVLDLEFPVHEGVAFLTELRRREETRDIPLVLLRPAGQAVDQISHLLLSGDECVSKPYDSAQVVSRAQALLADRPQPSRGELQARLDHNPSEALTASVGPSRISTGDSWTTPASTTCSAFGRECCVWGA
jgi:DNA-binding response OmpR family regulator